MRVFVYYNLHRKCLSVKALEGSERGRVLAHATHAYLENVSFKVSEAGRQRVLKERAKNVHAGVCGELKALSPSQLLKPLPLLQALPSTKGDAPGSDSQDSAASRRLTYDPYKFAHFVDAQTLQPVHGAAWCEIRDKAILAPA